MFVYGIKGIDGIGRRNLQRLHTLEKKSRNLELNPACIDPLRNDSACMKAPEKHYHAGCH